VPAHRHAHRLAAPASGEALEGFVEPRARRIIRRDVPDRFAGEFLEPEIGARIEFDDGHALVDHVDEGQEQGPVQPALIEPLRLHIRGGEDDDILGEQGLEQAPEDHRIGDVGDGELVEAQHIGFLRECLRHRFDRVVTLDPARLELLAIGVDAAVHIGHESVEMGPALSAHAEAFKEQIHQHGLAAPHRAPDVKPLDRLARGGAASEQPAERAALAREALFIELRGQFVEPREQARLGRITLDRA
jgi:hypothetical protein